MPLLLRTMIFALAISGLRNGYAQGDPASPSPVCRISGAGGLFVALGTADELQHASGTIGVRGGLVFSKRLLLGVHFCATSATLAAHAASSEGSLQVNENGL